MPEQTDRFDAIVIGAGIAGASVAAELSGHLRVALIERESQPGHHTTGRSAAVFTLAYGPPVIRALTRASHRFFQGRDGAPPDLLRRRGAMFIARADQATALARLRDELGDAVAPLTAQAARALQPLIREDYVAGGLIDRVASDIEVHGLHQHYLKRFSAGGGRLKTRTEAMGLTRDGGDWLVETRQGMLRAPVVVNAAGAWADEIAQAAGAPRLGLKPLRRTAVVVAAPDGVALGEAPIVVDVEERFYLKPDAGKLLISPADETPSPPCDAQPEELDVAICVDRIEIAFDLQIRRIEHKWAGLRSFFPDGDPVAGYDDAAPGFFWLAGQGGYGIQTAPALARTAAALIRGRCVPADIADQGVSAAALSPARPGLAA